MRRCKSVVVIQQYYVWVRIRNVLYKVIKMQVTFPTTARGELHYQIALGVGVVGVIGADQVKGSDRLLQYGAPALCEKARAVAGAGNYCEHNCYSLI